jgi:hypothetical protein
MVMGKNKLWDFGEMTGYWGKMHEQRLAGEREEASNVLT